MKGAIQQMLSFLPALSPDKSAFVKKVLVSIDNGQVIDFRKRVTWTHLTLEGFVSVPNDRPTWMMVATETIQAISFEFDREACEHHGVEPMPGAVLTHLHKQGRAA
jgi:hypothetical protein